MCVGGGATAWLVVVVVWGGEGVPRSWFHDCRLDTCLTSTVHVDWHHCLTQHQRTQPGGKKHR